jgi:hypothetical protein
MSNADDVIVGAYAVICHRDGKDVITNLSNFGEHDTRVRARLEHIAACVTGCFGIESPATTVPELVEVARQVCIGTCVCHASHRPDIPCEKCKARAVLAKTGKKP